MMKKKTPVEIGKVEMEYLATLKERDRRHFIACKAAGPKGGSIRAVCKAFGCSPNTVSKGIRELLNHIVPPDGRQRMPGGGAKRKTERHPEWVAAFSGIVSRHMAGLPQDESVVWIDIGVPQVRRELLPDFDYAPPRFRARVRMRLTPPATVVFSPAEASCRGVPSRILRWVA